MNYDEVAEPYSSFVTGYASTEHELGYPAVLDRLPPPPAKVLDFGCGDGHFSRRLLAQGYSVVSVDRSPSMIERARRHEGDYHVSDAGLAFLRGAEFDAAVATFVFCTMPSLDEIIANLTDLARVLRPGGAVTLLHSNYDTASGQDFASFRLEPIHEFVSGRPVTVVLKGDTDLSINDFYWADSDYLQAFQRSGFHDVSVARDLAPRQDRRWSTECEHAPFVVTHATK